MSDITAAILAATQRILPEIISIRHHLHRNPELSGQEHETAGLVAKYLKAWGLEDVRTDVGGQGGDGPTGKVQRQPRAGIAGGHGRAADPGNERLAVPILPHGRDARLRA